MKKIDYQRANLLLGDSLVSYYDRPKRLEDLLNFHVAIGTHMRRLGWLETGNIYGCTVPNPLYRALEKEGLYPLYLALEIEGLYE